MFWTPVVLFGRRSHSGFRKTCWVACGTTVCFGLLWCCLVGGAVAGWEIILGCIWNHCVFWTLVVLFGRRRH